MGKATILSEYGDGEYSVSMKYAGRAENEARIVVLNARIVELQAEYDVMPETTLDEIWDKRIKGLQIAALEKNVAYLTTAFPSDKTLSVWCIDLTTGLTGDIGFIEIPGEFQTGAKVNLVAGYSGQAAWDKDRDGQLTPPLAMGPWGTFLNKCMLPGWQKWSPLYRYGTIIADSIDFDANTCDVCLDPEHSSQQNLIVNQGQDFEDCKQIVYPQFTDFCSRNPTHPTCTNTEVPSPMFISDDQLAFLKSINASVNDAHEYQTDKSGYRIDDYWAIMTGSEKGDCEDFALTKMQALIDAGYPVKNLQIAIVGTGTFVDHAVLIIQTVNRGTLVLDNRYETVVEASTLPYSFQHYQRAGTDWRYFATMLETVLIEYMNCNAAAFADGDAVVVEFTGQDFSQPKVIGFKENPAACISGIMVFPGAFTYLADEMWGYIFDVSSGSYAVTSQYSTQATIMAACGSADNGVSVHYVGGTMLTIWYKLNRKYLINTDSWLTKAEMPTSRAYLSCFAMTDALYFLCGYAGNNILNENELYIPSTDSWAAKADHSGIRALQGEVVLSGKGYIWGGTSAQGNWFSTHSTNTMYDPVSDSWGGKANLPKAMVWMGAFEDFATQKGYFAGAATIGQWGSGRILDDDGLYLTERAYEYDPVENVWTRKTDFLTYGCDGRYYESADPPGWYINPDDCQDRAGYGPYNVPAAGGIDSGVVFQCAVGLYQVQGVDHVLKTGEYTPSTDSWESKPQQPEKFNPYYLMDYGCACAI